MIGVLIKFTLIVVLFLGPAIAHASEPQREFEPATWSEGAHLLAGLGLNSSLFTSDSERRDLGIGAYLKTDLDYFFSSSFAVEFSSGIEFNKVDAFLLWNTQVTLGIRYRIPRDPLFHTRSSYVRAFFGRSPTVIFLNGNAPPEYAALGIERLHFDGPVGGASIGMFRQTPGNRVWFYEFSFTVQRLEQENAVRMQGEVPIVLIQNNTTDHSTIYGLNFAVGTIFF